MEIIEQLVDFSNNRNKEIVSDFENIDMIKASVICFEILDWISSINRHLCSNDSKEANDYKKMKLEYKYEWCNILRAILLNKNKDLSKLFLIEDCYLNFKENVSDEEKRKIIEYVSNNYHPIVTTYKKR